MQNLDAEINQLSYNMFREINKLWNDKKEVVNLCEKSLWVLSQDWPYAYYVFIKSKVKEWRKTKEKKIKEIYNEKIFNFFFKENWIFSEYIQNDNLEESIQKLSENLHQYLYFKEILEKILTYLRYHLKTLDSNENKNE